MKILYTDDRVIVCIKPVGILSTDEPGGMPELLRKELGEDLSIKSVHRLDRAVGGVMVYARTKRAAADLSRQIQRGEFHKTYLAVVHGIPSHRQGELRDWLHRDKARKMTFVTPEGTPEAQEAILKYEMMGSYEDLSMLKIQLLTGRTHQIRCQLSSRGWPIAGDVKYGAPNDGCGVALWSYMIEFLHPRNGGRMSFIHKPENTYPWNRFFAEPAAE
jgi:23S rRNA pseudouridine1911/1915/1917 synthase